MQVNSDIIDIIVPVYNAERVLKKCITSIQRQTFQNWKLILVDDGSTDNSLKICEEFAKRDNRMLVIHQKNQGAIAARYAGMAYPTTARYGTFADADDYLPPNALEVLYKKITEYNADVVCGNLVRFNKWNLKFKTSKPLLLQKEAVFQPGTADWNMLTQSFFGVSTFSGYMHTKLYRRELLQKALSFRKPCFFFQEDIAFNLQIILQCSKVVTIPDIVYCYRMGGGTSKFMPDFLNDSIALYQFKKDIIAENSFPEDYRYTTAVELKNELWTWLEMFYENVHEHMETFRTEITRCVNIPEIIEAVNYPRQDSSGMSGFRELVQEKNIFQISQMVRAEYRKRKPVELLKKMVR